MIATKPQAMANWCGCDECIPETSPLFMRSDPLQPHLFGGELCPFAYIIVGVIP